ncbi:MAG TPA: aminodeoxychorismate/anthranilate synthase component II [Terriglobales bacterium]|nr:aminodeoxychorismate/anthranilate synthase component II [Terriglobales bacterium]
MTSAGARTPLLVLDNYDSFTFNLVQYLRELTTDVVVIRNDEISVDEILALAPRAIVISPGPGRPEQAGICMDLVARGAGIVPMLGVCLGHQAIAAAFGAQVGQAPQLMHGKTSPVRHDGQTLFRGLPNPFEAMRYHSLIVEREGLPDCFAVSAWTEDRQIMAVRHRAHPLEGVQFHPESFLTAAGMALLRNFVELYGRGHSLVAQQADPA